MTSYERKIFGALYQLVRGPFFENRVCFDRRETIHDPFQLDVQFFYISRMTNEDLNMLEWSVIKSKGLVRNYS